MKETTAIIIGAGVVGLACAMELSRRGFTVYILEAGPRIAEGVSSRNSGVIHSPLNYPAQSLKADLCLEGRELLYEWCEKHSVPHRQTGKLIVATTDEETEALESIFLAGLNNGAKEIKMISQKEISQLQSGITGTQALFSPRTGIVDPYELARSYLIEAEKNGATLLTQTAVQSVHRRANGYEVETSRGPIQGDVVINSAGLHADEIAELAGIKSYKIYPWKGNYFTLRALSSIRFEKLIYPVKAKGAAGLGIHLTLDLAGRYRLGPDVEPVSTKNDFCERADKREAFAQAAKKLFPWVEPEMLSYDTCGIRPKLRSPSDLTEKDFVISQDLPGWINLMGIESPGLTASLAIAKKAASMLA